MKYGFWRDPSFRSKSSTVKRATCWELTRFWYPGLWLFDNERRNRLTEAEKECVHTHVVHTEESMSYEVASNNDGLHSTDWQRE